MCAKRSIAVALALALTAPALAQSGATLLTRGNEKFKAKDYEAAADLYHQAQSAKNPPAAKALYNEGCALLEQNKPDEAGARFREADAKAGPDRDLSARARFNLGQSLFKQAEPLKDQQPEQALDLLRQSAAAYRSVLDAAPADAEASRNVEIARRLMKQIEDKKREQQKQDQKNQQQQNQKGGKGEKGQQSEGGESGDQEQQEQQRQADQLKDLAKRQRQAAAESQKAEQNSPDQQSAGERQKQQKDLKEDTAKAEAEQKDSGGPETDQLKKAQEEQQKALDELGKQNPGAAKQHQEAAAKALEQAAKEAQDTADQAKRDGEKESKDPGKQDGKEPGESAQQGNADPKKDQNYDKTAAALLDRERKLHQQRQPVIRAPRGTGAPVEKDW